MRYFFSHDGKTQHGPVEATQLRQAGATLDTLVWREGMTDWTPARNVPELAAIMGSPAAPMPAPSGPTQWTPPPADPVVAYQTPQQNNLSANGMAITSMILGIISVTLLWCYFFGVLPAIVGVVFGHIARGQIRRGQGTGAGMALAGLICSYITIGLAALLVGALAMFFVFATPRTLTPAPVPVRVAPTPPTTVPTNPTPAAPWE